jgi:hypothetical protein
MNPPAYPHALMVQAMGVRMRPKIRLLRDEGEDEKGQKAFKIKGRFLNWLPGPDSNQRPSG